jgi:hypothetical protein
MTEGDIVECWWIDSATTSSGWSDLSELTNEITPIKTAGYLMHSNQDAVTIALSLDPENENFNGAITIPVVCIKSLERLSKVVE